MEAHCHLTPSSIRFPEDQSFQYSSTRCTILLQHCYRQLKQLKSGMMEEKIGIQHLGEAHKKTYCTLVVVLLRVKI